jgi:hypothetical protein
MSDKRDQASEELLPDELVDDENAVDDMDMVYGEEDLDDLSMDTGEEDLEDTSTEYNEAEFHDETNDAANIVDDLDLGEAVYNEEMFDEDDLEDSPLNRTTPHAPSDDNDLER